MQRKEQTIGTWNCGQKLLFIKIKEKVSALW
jgi:hypothetical protein